MEDDPVGSACLISEHAGFFLDKFLAGVGFQFDELADNFEESIEDLAL